MLIELDRIISKKKKDGAGNIIKDPTDNSKNLYYNVKSPEAFKIEDIKRTRSWNRRKGSSEYPEIEGDISVVFVETLNRDGVAKLEEIRVNESHSKLLDRLNALKLEHEYGAKEK